MDTLRLIERLSEITGCGENVWLRLTGEQRRNGKLARISATFFAQSKTNAAALSALDEVKGKASAYEGSEGILMLIPVSPAVLSGEHEDGCISYKQKYDIVYEEGYYDGE